MAEFLDIDRNFTLDAKGDISIAVDNVALKQSITSIIFTATGAKVGDSSINPIYGVGINKYLFAPLNNFAARSLGESIFRHLTIFEPRINVENVNVVAVTASKSFEVEISYTIVGISKAYVYRTVINQN
jgi:phage baseplate assembly protein W